MTKADICQFVANQKPGVLGRLSGPGRITRPCGHRAPLLELALQGMGQAGLDAIPVVSRANVRELEGVVTLLDILKPYGLGPAGASQEILPGEQ